jgi:diaminohydroxyphosphoribosylaminopyrimidine deaminase/5-amino-6-(5-phosphoribosylamino)uracil reductase
MKRCLELASNGAVRVAPNPMVGAIVVHNNHVIGEGYHVQHGQAHAEAIAIDVVKDQSLLKESTLYINLEPCTHIGKTPPCIDLILCKNIPRVIIGTPDTNPLVAGKGIEKLIRNGLEVITGILGPECRELNRRFFTFHEQHRPYIILKWAQTNDGFIDVIRQPGESAGVNWISNPLSRTLVHRWRTKEQAIMVGTDTVLFDNPRFNVRYWYGNNPLKIILDRTLRIPTSYNVFNSSSSTIVFNEKRNESAGNTEFVKIRFGAGTLERIFTELYKRQVLSVIVEGGKKLFGSLIKENLWDEARVFIGNKNFGKGLPAPIILQKPDAVGKILNDRLLLYTRRPLR